MLRSFTTSDVPVRNDEIDIVCSPAGTIFVRSGRGIQVLRDIDPGDLASILAEVNGTRDVVAIAESLSARYAPEDVAMVVEQLSGGILGWRKKMPTSRRDSAAEVPRIGVVGEGLLAQTIRAELRSVRGIEVQTIVPPTIGLDAADVLKHRTAAQVLQSRVRGPGDERAAVDPGGGPAAASAWARQLEGYAAVVCAPENVFFRQILAVAQAAAASRTMVIFVTMDPDALLIGPTFIPGYTACFACAELQVHFPQSTQQQAMEVLDLFSTSNVEVNWEAPLNAARLAAEEVATELMALLRPGNRRTAQLFTQLRRIPIKIRPKLESVGPLLPLEGCPHCSATRSRTRPESETSIELAASVALATARTHAGAESMDYHLRIEPGAEGTPLDLVKTVGVIGGGTAGYLTALALKQKVPDIEVKLVESSQIPIIGVGEATTPDMVHFLHATLGLDLAEFYEKVAPTWKLGIKFFWGNPGEYFFNYPFSHSAALSEALAYSGDINVMSIESMLMSAERAPILRTADGQYISLLEKVRYAYHLDNKRFVRYLQEKAIERGIELLDETIVDVVTRPEHQEVDHLRTKSGRRLAFDLFVDCTGFRSALLEKALGSPFIDYRSSLFTDTAVAAAVPHAGLLKPYTYAESMNNGWCWNIPQREENHRGYVFSSAFCTVDQAMEEMKTKNPGMVDPWVVHFRSGRHEHFWRGNVVAIGNAYGFVEPLESTGLHMAVFSIRELVRSFPVVKRDAAFKRVLDERVGAHWDYLRWFLAVHYRFNRKFDTPFWRACRESADVSGLEKVLALYREEAPLSDRRDGDTLTAEMFPDRLFGLGGVDCLLAGQQVASNRQAKPRRSREEWAHRLQYGGDRVVNWALPQKEALDLLERRPDLLPAGSMYDVFGV